MTPEVIDTTKTIEIPIFRFEKKKPVLRVEKAPVKETVKTPEVKKPVKKKEAKKTVEQLATEIADFIKDKV